VQPKSFFEQRGSQAGCPATKAERQEKSYGKAFNETVHPMDVADRDHAFEQQCAR
jgi:hypothetical protein